MMVNGYAKHHFYLWCFTKHQKIFSNTIWKEENGLLHLGSCDKQLSIGECRQIVSWNRNKYYIVFCVIYCSTVFIRTEQKEINGTLYCEKMWINTKLLLHATAFSKQSIFEFIFFMNLNIKRSFISDEKYK